jgi:hypothetical protein
MDPGAFGAPVGILYNVTWFPNTPEALQKVPEGIQTLAAKAPMQTTLMVSSNPLVDGAACGGPRVCRQFTRGDARGGGTAVEGGKISTRRQGNRAGQPDV